MGDPLVALAFDPSPLPDYALAARLQAGDPAALAEIYDLYGRVVYSLALRLLAEPAAAEDVTHDVFLKLRRRPDQYHVQRGSLRAWLLSVAHNRSIDLLRRRRVAAQWVSADDQEWELISQENATDPGEDAARAEDAERVRWALAQIPPAQRQAIEMSFFEGKTHVEISAALGEPLGTAKTRIRLGMRKLRTLLESSGVMAESA
jgi:RNA polymerase sigma-70 factor, ECF subfamily